jgi:hypothetical protein
MMLAFYPWEPELHGNDAAPQRWEGESFIVKIKEKWFSTPLGSKPLFFVS